MASIPKPVPGLVFRYDYLRPHEAIAGIENGKERPACILVVLRADECLSGVNVISEDGRSRKGDYVASENDVIVIPIQSDPPNKHQLGVILDVDTKKYIGLPDDRVSYAIVSEVNIDTWPNGGIQDLPGRPGQWSYGRLMPGPKLAEIAKAFRRLRELQHVHAVLRQP